MANAARGQTTLNVPDVGEVTLQLTMGAMAELEDAFDVENIQQVFDKLGENTSSTNLAKVIKALMMGTPHASTPLEQVRRWPISPTAIREAMAGMGGTDEGNAPEPEGNRQQRRAAKSKKLKAK